jgi:hypothetical protein
LESRIKGSHVGLDYLLDTELCSTLPRGSERPLWEAGSKYTPEGKTDSSADLKMAASENLASWPANHIAPSSSSGGQVHLLEGESSLLEKHGVLPQLGLSSVLAKVSTNSLKQGGRVFLFCFVLF